MADLRRDTLGRRHRGSYCGGRPGDGPSARVAGLLELKACGVLATGPYRLRFVTHLDVDAAGIDRAVAALRECLAAVPESPR